MRVIRHESGWDIAMDMVFTDKTTAHTIAQRIRHGVHALIRDAVDASMCGCKAANVTRGQRLSGTAPGQPLAGAQMLASRRQQG
jgi:hypothetical protein